MKISLAHARFVTASGLLLAGTAALADDTRFSDFTPLAASAGPTADEATPITFGNPAIQQRSIANRSAVLAEGKPNSGNWDMNTVNETGRQDGRFLFTVFETGQGGIQRHDLQTGVSQTFWAAPAAAPAPNSAVAQSREARPTSSSPQPERAAS